MLLASEGRPVQLWGRNPALVKNLQATRENELYLPGVRFPNSLHVTSELPEAMKETELVIVAVPTQAVLSLARSCRQLGLTPKRILSATKGLEAASFRTMTQVLEREFEGVPALAALSGPNLAREIAAGQPAAAVIASQNPETSRWIQGVFTSPTFRAYTSTDVVGVELGGALKNVLALAAGMLTELGLGANTQAAMLTRGLAEISRLGCSLGADPMTFHGLAGLGDILATCTSSLSRNFRAGRMAARGLDPKGIRLGLGQAVEGLETVQVVQKLATDQGIEMPIARQVYRVLFEQCPAQKAAQALLARPLGPERGDHAGQEEVAL
jgi:glycerol-3-phosphate dehydrogenase (NAD(P)+)